MPLGSDAGKAFRCTSCGTTFDDDAAVQRCPKCLKQSTVEHVPVVGPAEAPSTLPIAGTSPLLERRPVDASSDDEDARTASSRRALRGVAFAVVPALLGGLLTAGGLGERWDPRLAVIIGASGGPIAGWLIGRDVADRIFTGVASVVGAMGVVMAATFYVATHERATGLDVGVEVLVPMLLGALPGLLVLLAFRKLAPRLVPRFALAVVALVGCLVVLASC